MLLEGRGPEQRPHFTLGYSEFVWARDEGYAMFGRNDGEEAKLYDLLADPEMDRTWPRSAPTWSGGCSTSSIGDAGGPLPTY